MKFVCPGGGGEGEIKLSYPHSVNKVVFEYVIKLKCKQKNFIGL